MNAARQPTWVVVNDATAQQIEKVLRRSSSIDHKTPEVNLWLAVLGVAINDAMEEPHRGRLSGVTVEARRFFAERGLDAICDCAGLNPQYVRELLRDHAGQWAADIATARRGPAETGDCRNKALRRHTTRGHHGQRGEAAR